MGQVKFHIEICGQIYNSIFKLDHFKSFYPI